MEKLIELLKQIQDLAGVAVDALQGANGEHGGQHGAPEGQHGAPGGGGGHPPEGSPAEERGESPAEAKREGDAPRRY